jgi:hypothetical protein
VPWLASKYPTEEENVSVNGRLRRALLSAGVVAAVIAPSAMATTMHPELGARVAGMGEHGIVNLRVKSTSGQICWVFDLPASLRATASSIHTGLNGALLVRLGKTYSKSGCTKAEAMVLKHLETKPASYAIFVDTKGHPGELRGKLFVGMAHM